MSTQTARPTAGTILPTEGQSAAARRGTHLTRRGRVVVLLVVLALLLGAFAFGRSVSSAATTPDAAPPVRQTVVAQGDTLWSLARDLAPGRDPRPLVSQIRRLNHLGPATSLRPGIGLLLPAAP